MMRQTKFTCAGLLAAFLTTTVSITAFAVNDDALLEQRIQSETTKNTAEIIAKPLSLEESYGELKTFVTIARPKTPRCDDVQKSVFADKYVLTTDAEGKACRIYDLSFPNLKALFAAKKAMQIPIQRMTSRDYLNWLDGNQTAVDESMSQYKKNFNPLNAARNSWVSRLRFKNRPTAVPGSQIFPGDIGLPQSFRLSDLDLGRKFQFDAQTKSAIENLMLAMGEESDLLPSDYYMKVVSNPETLLAGIKFNWNDLEKVYDVILEGEFLPLKPVALVEYQTQYKYAVEKMFRSLLTSGLVRLAQMIPTPMIASAVEVLVTDAFEQLEMAYEYQMLQLEDTLKTIDPAFSTRALNVLYGQRADLLTAYITAMLQGKPFDWQAAEKLGKNARYANDKARDVMMSKMNSKLVLEKQCQNQFVHDYFAVCTKDGKETALYSLISEQKVFSKSFGAPVVYKYDRPYETAARRGGAWILSIALRVVGLPINRDLVGKLDGVLKGYMKAGLLDEALLRNHFSMQAKKPEGDIMKWMYIQNLNVFLPKSVDGENKVISANKSLLGVNLQ